MNTNVENLIRRYVKRNIDVFRSNKINAKKVTISLAARHMTIAWRLMNPNQLQPALKLSETIALAAHTPAVLGYRDHSYIIYQFQLHDQYWQSYTRNDVKKLGVGLGDRRRQVDIEFPESFPQIGIFGTTGSGKTELIKSAICALSSTFTPDELKFIISDWHRQLTDFDNLAHLAAPIARTDEETESILSLARQEQARRLNNASDNGYRLVFVIDEAAEIVTTDDRIRTLRDIANSRKWNLNLILGTQKPTSKDLPGIIDKVNNRFVGYLANAQTSAFVTGHAGLEANKLTGGGDFLHVTGPRHDRFQVAVATEADIAKLPRAEVTMPDVALSATVNIPESAGPGRPESKVEPALVADYLANYEMSVRQFIREREISQRKYYLAKEFAEELKIELAKYGLGICKVEVLQ